MKKVLLVLIVFFSNFQLVNAQRMSNWDYYFDTKSFERHQILLSIGYGAPRLDNKLFDYHKNEEAFRVFGIGPFVAKAEYGLSRKLGIGLSTAYINYKSDWIRRRPDPLMPSDSLRYRYSTTYQDISVNLRLNYHILITKDIDVYLGGGVGYNKTKHNDSTNYYPDVPKFDAQFKDPYIISSEVSIGVRYYFLTRTAFFIELGYGKSVAQAGFVFKFRPHKRE
jgi:hypothetical protein